MGLGSAQTEAIRLIISGDSKGAVKALEDVGGAVSKTGKGTVSTMEAMNKAAKVVAGAFLAIGAVIIKSVKDYETFAILVAKVSAQTDMGAEATSRFVGQLQMLHVDTGKAGMAIKTMENAIYGLKTGAAASVDTFKILNLTWEDLKDLKPEDQIALIRDRLSQLEDPAARSQAATKLLGRGAKDMALWYTASKNAMGELNQTLEDNHQILSEKQLADAKAAAGAWQAMTGALKGFEYMLAQGVLPAFTKLFLGITWMTQHLGPLGSTAIPVLAVATGVLAAALGSLWAVQKVVTIWTSAWAAAVGLLNTVMAVNAIRMGEMTAVEAFYSLTQKDLVGTTVAAAGAEEGLAGATVASTGAMRAGIIQLGLYAAALGVAYLAVMKIVDAYNQWANATKREKDQLAGLKANLDAVTPADRAKMAAAAAAWHGQGPNPYASPNTSGDAYKPPSGFWGWAGAVLQSEASFGSKATKFFGFAGGTDHVTNGPEVFVAGEGGRRERVTVTPLSRGNGGSGAVVVNFIVHGSVVGGKAGLRELSGMVQRDVMSGVQRAMVGQHA